MSNTEPEFLQTPEDDIMENEDAILERDGVHFINSSVFTPDRQTEAALDTDFRDLVDSVIR